jgi:hypothetical protein
MPRRRAQHIDHLLRDWPYDPETVSVRLVTGADSRDVIQMRVDMGVLQLETTARPDGARPKGFQTYYDFLLAESVRVGEDFLLDEEQCSEADREFVQFYHRRICWLALRRFADAVRDADHTLAFMDFCGKHSPDEQWTLSHEQYRPFVLFHRTQAAALTELDDGAGPESAVQAINDGLERMRQVFEEFEAEEHFEEDDLVSRLIELRESLREHYSVGRTLEERLTEAIQSEQYELAAVLRDELAKRHGKRH